MLEKLGKIRENLKKFGFRNCGHFGKFGKFWNFWNFLKNLEKFEKILI
jgi:hypothetical protein